MNDLKRIKIINYFEKNNIEGIPRDIDLTRFTLENNCIYFNYENKHKKACTES